MKERLELLEQENMQLRDELGSLSLYIDELQSALREITDMPERSSGVRACIATARAALNEDALFADSCPTCRGREVLGGHGDLRPCPDCQKVTSGL